jgi:hypothetical protein
MNNSLTNNKLKLSKYYEGKKKKIKHLKTSLHSIKQSYKNKHHNNFNKKSYNSNSDSESSTCIEYDDNSPSVVFSNKEINKITKNIKEISFILKTFSNYHLIHNDEFEEIINTVKDYETIQNEVENDNIMALSIFDKIRNILKSYSIYTDLKDQINIFLELSNINIDSTHVDPNINIFLTNIDKSIDFINKILSYYQKESNEDLEYMTELESRNDYLLSCIEEQNQSIKKAKQIIKDLQSK